MYMLFNVLFLLSRLYEKEIVIGKAQSPLQRYCHSQIVKVVHMHEVSICCVTEYQVFKNEFEFQKLLKIHY